MNTLLILALVAGAHSGPISHNTGETCASSCTASSNKFGYDAGHTYEFRYGADTVTKLTGAAQEHSSIHISATVNVEVLSTCEHVLVLKDVLLEDSDPRNLATRQRAPNHDEFRRALEKNPLRFSFQDGRVDRLCSQQDEPSWVMNVKRGVLSTFQNSMESLEKDHQVSETDVAGKCQAEYKISGSGWNSVTIKKSKNLLGCTDRQGGLSAVQATPYTLPSEIQSLPLLKSTHECEQNVRPGGHLESSKCEETHVFRPFSKERSGASTQTTQELKFVRKYSLPMSRRVGFNKHSSMLFEHTPEERDTARDISQVETILQTLCNSNDVRPSTPAHFTELVYMLKRLNTAAMHNLHRKIHSDKFCSHAHKYFEDAIPMVGSSASLSFMKELMSREKVDADRVSVWMSSLAFINKPDAGMIREARGLLDLKNQEQVILPVSALVNSYCRHNSQCGNEPDVQEIVRILRENLGISCRTTTDGERRKMMKSMKAIGNIPVSNSASDALKRCYTDYKNPTDVRVAAIDAMRRMPCDVPREEMMEILTDADLDSELRIAAYMGLMKCPSRELIGQIKTLLEKEEVNQVASFIWTHFTNLQTTGDIFKKDIAAILMDQKLAKEFDMDKRKFSRNYEKSFFLHSFNVGGKAEGNLIWSQKSFIPRSGSLNLTVDVFGQSVNLLEFGGRVEGLDRLLESLLGPDGYFKKGPKKESREKRSVSGLGQLERLHKKYALKPEDDLQGSAYMRMFGNDLAYMDLKDLKTKKGQEFNILEFLIKLAQDHKYDVSRSYMFLDSSLTVPTAAGLPLKLAVNGTATVRLHVEGKMDLRKLGTSPRSLDIDGSIKPSGAIEIASMMSVDAYHARTGLRMVTSLHSSTGVDGKLKIEDSQIITAQLNWPKDKIEIFNLQSEFFVMHRERPVSQTVMPGRLMDRKMCSGRRLQQSLGMQLCGEFKVAKAATDSPLFPLTGPASASITLQKTDTHNSYEFDARMLAKKDRKTKSTTYHARVAFNTPGSQVDRELLTEFILDTHNKDVKFEIRTPWKKVAIGGSVTNTDAVKRVQARVMLDENQEMSLLGEVQLEQSAKKMTIMPKLELKAPWIKPWTVEGKAEAVYGKEYSTDVSVNIMDKPVSFKGSLEMEGRGRYDTNVQLTTPVGSAKVNGFLENRRISSRTRVMVTYDLFTDQMHKLTFSGKTKAISKGLAAKYQANGAFQSTQYPHTNMEIDVAAGKTKRVWDQTMEIRFGEDMKDTNKRIFFKQLIRRASKGDTYSVDQSAKLLFKLFDINVATKLAHKHSPTSIKSQAVVNYTPTKEINLDVDLSMKEDKPIHYNGDISLSYPGRELRITDTLQESAGNSYRHQLMLQWQKKRQITINTNYKPDGLRHDVRTEIKYPNGFRFHDSILSGTVVLNPKDFQGKVELLHGSDTYSSTVNYNIANTAGKGNVDIVYPGRHIVASVTGAKKGSSYDGRLITRWDADGDKSKKVIIDGRFTTDVNNLEGHIKVSHPDRVIRAMFDKKTTDRRHSSHAEVSWDQGQKIVLDTDITMKNIGRSKRFEGRMRFISPFRRFELLKLNAGHKDDGLTMNTEGDFSWAPQKTLSFQNSIKRNRKWSNADVKTTITTPIEGAEKIEAKTTYKVTNDDIASTFVGEMNKHKVELEVKGQALLYKIKKDLQGSLSLKTTFDKIRDAAVKTTYKYTRQGVEATAEGSLNGKSVSLTIKGADKGTSDSRNMESSVQVSTPFEDFKTMELNIRHVDDGKQFTSRLQGKLEDKEVTAAANVNHDGSGYEFKNQGNFEVKTPFRQARIIGASWNAENGDGKANSHLEVEHNGEKLTFDMEGRHKSGSFGRRISTKMMLKPMYSSTRFNTNINMKHNRKGAEANLMFARNGKKDIDFSAELNKEDKTNFDIKVEMKSGFKKLEDVSALLSLKASAQPATARAELKWTSDDKVTVDTDWMSVSGRSKGNVRIYTPFQNFEKTILSGEYLKSSGKHTLSSQVLYGQNKKMELKSSYGSGKGAFEFNSACPYFKSLVGEFELTGSLSEFKNNMRLVYEGKQRTFFESALEHDASKTSGNFHLQTPCKIVRDIRYSFTNTRANDYQTTFKVDINNEHTVEGISKDKIGTGKFSHYSQLTSTFDNFKKIVTKIDTDYNSYGFTSKLSSEAHVAGETTKGEFLFDASTYGKKAFTLTSSLTSSWCTDVSGTVSASINSNTYASNVEIKYEPNNIISFSSFVNTERKVRGQMRLQTPFELVPRLEVQLEHMGDLKNFKTDGEIDYSPWNGKVEGRMAFRLNGNDVSGRINVKSPFRGFERAAAEVKHQTRRNTYDTMVRATFGREQVNIQSDLKIASLKRIEGTIIASTSYDILRNMKVTFNHRCNSDNMNTQFEYQRNGRPKTELLIAFSKQNGYTGKATFQSPIKGAEFLELAFNHRGNSYQLIESHAEISYSRTEKMEADFTFRVSPDFKTTFSMKTPFTQDVELQVTHSGNSQAFRCHAEYTRGGEKRIQGDLDAVLTRPEMSLRANLKTPFTYFKDISYTATSTVTEESVRSTAELSYYHGKIVKVLNIDLYDGTVNRVFVNLKTPYYKDIEGVLSYSFRNSKLTSSFLGKYDNEKKIDYSSELILKPRISGTLSLSTACSFPDIRASFSHAGEATDFKTSGKVVLDQNRMYSADVSFSFDKTLEASAQITTPELNTISANLKNHFTKRRLNTEVAVTYDGKKIELDSKIRFKPNIDMVISVQTPFKKYEENLLTIKFDYESNSINGNARFTQMNSIQFSTLLRASKLPMALDFNLAMPILDLAPFTLSVKAQGEPKNFRFDGEMNHGMGKVTTTASFKMAESIEGSFELSTPYNKVGKIELAFNHEGGLTSFSNNANLNTPIGKFTYSGRFSSTDKVSGNFQIKTPYPQADDVQVSFDHAGTYMNFRNMLSITAPCGKTTYTGSFSKTDRIEGSFKITSPVKTYNSISLIFNHEGGFKSFNNAISFVTPVTKLGYKGSFTLKPINGDFIVTANNRKWEVKFGQTGEYSGFAKVNSNDQQLVSLTGNVQVRPQVTAAFVLETPFPYMEKWRANYNQELDANTKTFHADVTYMNKAATADVELRNKGTDVRVSVTTPFEKFEQISYIGKLEGDFEEFKVQNTFNSHLGEISLSGEFSKWPLEASVSLTTPFKYAEDLNAGIKYNNDGNTRKAHGEASYKSKKVAFDVEQVAKTIKAKFTSPFENFKDITYNGGVEGGLKDFKFTSDLTYVHGKIDVSGEFDMKPSLIAKLKVNTPYEGYDHLTVNLKVNPRGKLGNLAVTIPMGTFRIKGELEDQTAKLLIRSPFRSLRELTASATVKAEGPKMSANLEVDRNDAKEIHFDATVEGGVKQTVKAEFTSKYTERAALEGSLKSARGDIDANAQITYGSDNILDTSIDANVKSMNDIIVTYKLDSAYRYLKDLQLITEHRIEGYNVITNIDARYAPGKHIKASLQYTHGDSKEGKVSLETPFKDYSSMSATFSHKGTWKKFEDEATVLYMGDEVVKVHASFTLGRRTSGELTIDNPFKNVKVMFNHEGDMKHFENSGSLSWGPSIEASSRYSYDSRKITGGFTLNTPFVHARQMSGSFSHEGNMERFTNKVDVSYAPGKVIKTETTFSNGVKTSGTFTLVTPFQTVDRVSVSVEHEGTLKDFSTTATATLPRRKVINGKIEFSTGSKTFLSAKLTTPFPPAEDVGFSVNHKGGFRRFDNKVQVQMSRDQIIKAETAFTTEQRISGSFVLKTPFQKVGDVNAMIRHEGGWTDFSNVAELQMASRNYKAESKFTSNERATSGSLSLKSPANELTMQVNHEGNLKRFSNSAALNINDKSFTAQSSFSYAYRTVGNIVVNTPWRAVSASLDHEGDASQFRTNAEVKYGPSESLRTTVNFVNRPGRTSADVKLFTPFKQVNDVSAGFVHSGNARKFSTVITATYAGKTLQSNTVFSHSKESSRISYKHTTPFDMIRHLDISASRDGTLRNFKVFASVSHNQENSFSVEATHSNSGYNDFRCSGIIRTTLENLRELSAIVNHHHEGTSEVASSASVAYNGRTVFGATVKHTTDKDGAAGSITMSYPSTFSYEYDIKKTEKELSGKVTVNQDYSVTFSNKDASTYYTEKRTMVLQTVMPSRTMLLKGELEKSGSRFVKTGTFSWDAARRRQIAYSLELEDNSRRYQKAYSAKARVDTPLRSVEAIMTHSSDSATYTSTSSFKWDAARDASKALTVKNIYEKTGTAHKNELSLRAPGMDQDLIMRGEMIINHGAIIFMTKGAIDYNRNPTDILSFNVRVSDESTGYAHNYSLNFDLTHPRSTLEVHGNAHAANYPSKASTGLNLSYLTATRKTKNILLLAEIQKLRKQISLKMESPLKTMSMTGQVTESRGNYMGIATAFVDEQSVKAMFKLDTQKKSVDFKTNYNPENSRDEFVITGRYKSMSELEGEAYHTSSGRKTTDALLEMDLKNKHLLHTRIYWRPSMYFDIKYGGKKLLKDAKTEAISMWDSLEQHAKQEARLKSTLISRATPSMDAFIEAMVAEGRSLLQDADDVITAWNRMVQDNEFFLKDIKESTSAAVRYLDVKIREISGMVIEVVAKGLLALNELYQDMMAKLSQIRLACCEAIAKYMHVSFRKVVEAYNAFARVVTQVSDLAEAAVADLQAKIMKLAKKAAAKAQELNAAAMDKLAMWWQAAVLRAQPFMDATSVMYQNAVQKVTTHPVYLQAQRKVIFYKNKVAAKVSDVKRRLSEIDLTKPVRDLHLNIKERLTNAMDFLKKYTMTVSKKFNQAYNYVENKVENAAENLIAREHFKLVKNILNEIYHKATWVYEHYQIEARIKEGVSDVLTLGFRFVKKNVMYLAIEYLKLDQDRIIVYDPSKAELEFEVYIPLEWPHLQTLPAIDMAHTLVKAKEQVSKYIPLDYSPWDTYYKYKPSKNPADWVPPFKAIASLSGDQHYMTFDRRFYSFAGTCSYVLARDMADGDFSVVVNYQGNRRSATRKSLTVVTNGKEVELVKNYRVKVDGKLTNLPIKFLNTTITRDGNIVTLTNSKGFEVECDFISDRCTMEISGWYFGRTAGLFGVYNNEPSDDFTTPERTKVTDAADFAKSWLVSKSCRINDNVARTQEPVEGSRHTKMCAELLRSNSSPYRKCFKQVTNVPFFRMCVNYEDEGLCKAASMYVRHCKQEGVRLQMPKQCRRCDSMGEGETKKITDDEVPKSADIVFVVEQNACNKEAGSKLIGIARNIELSLKEKLMKNNHYGIVGFGGTATDGPTMHSIEGQFLGDIKDFRGAELTFEDGTNKDDVSAIETATRYPFRAGVSKIIVLITCGSCDSSSKYQQVKDTLTSQGFQLHVLRSHELEMEDNVKTPKTNYLYGVDKDTAYTKNSGNRLASDRALHARLQMPDNQCYDLAVATQGSYFNLDKLVSGRRVAQKSFMHVLGMRVAKTAPPSPCSTCECVTDTYGNTRTVCKPCHSTPMIPLQPSRPQLLGRPGEEPERFYKPKPIAQPATFDLDYEESQ